jgi:hypothetical protein
MELISAARTKKTRNINGSRQDEVLSQRSVGQPDEKNMTCIYDGQIYDGDSN